MYSLLIGMINGGILVCIIHFQVMNNTKDLFYRGGVTFDNFFVTTPICCPSRVSLLSARFAHSAGAVATTPAGWCGVGKYWKAPMQNKSVPTWMQNQGYRTGLFGKELNVNDDTYISPGWDTFFALGGTSEGHYYNDWFNDQGHRFTAVPGQYMTALIQERAVAFINKALQAAGGNRNCATWSIRVRGIARRAHSTLRFN